MNDLSSTKARANCHQKCRIIQANGQSDTHRGAHSPIREQSCGPVTSLGGIHINPWPTCNSGAEPRHWVRETDARTSRLSRRNMLRMLLLCLGLLQGLHAILASNPNHSRLDEVGSILDEAGRSSYSSLLQLVKEAPPDFEQLALEVPIAQDDLVSEASNVMEPQMLLTALQAQGREERSPRRTTHWLCVVHRTIANFSDIISPVNKSISLQNDTLKH
ncbi:hypothetical protein lerEdw1_001091 [Lerista edwardsae]|nr:hypothetical protein lerEdw1_001091 [Lerista edwardsae]